MMGSAIPLLVTLLITEKNTIREGVAFTLVNLAEHGML